MTDDFHSRRAARRPASPFLAAIDRRPVVYDGAMGTSIQACALAPADFGGPTFDGCNDYLVVTRPDVIQRIHESFLEAGCDVVETCTFQATTRRLGEWGLAERARAINVAAAQIARSACARWSTPDRPRFVAGAIGPTGLLPSGDDPVLSAVTFEALVREFHEQAGALLEGGVDLLLVETMQDLLEVKAAVVGIERVCAERGVRVPVQVQVTLDTSGRMLLGTDIAAALATLESLDVDVIGLNCSTGPEYMREPVRYLLEHATRPVAVMPNAGLPVNTGSGEVTYPLAPQPMAAMLAEFVRDGVRVVGGCCGTTPAHIRDVVRAIAALPDAAAARVWTSAAARRVPSVASAMRAVALQQEPPPLLVGERINAQGSRKVKRLLLDEDYDGIVDIARDQMDAGAHVLDVCVATTERGDEAAQMAAVVKRLSLTVEAPLMIDSTEPSVIARALEHVPGRAIVNSINMENGRGRVDSVVPLARTHGAALVALTIDEQGMARTMDRKLAIARRIHDIVVGEYGMPPDALLFDALTFTLGTGDAEWRDSAKETIDGIRAIKRELPGVLTILGVSNVSFGLAAHARPVLNSVFLHHCVEAGLDAAIVNPAHVQPYAEIPDEERRLATDVIFNRAPDALQRFIAHVDAARPDAAAAADGGAAEGEGLTPDRVVHRLIVERRKEGLEAALDACGVREDPVRVLNEVLLPAMKEVGDRFGAGELILPFVLQSAEVMKRAVRYVEQFLDRRDGRTKGTIVLATVYGDVHDIGKSLLGTILANNGYTVHDLGKQVPVNAIIDKAIETQADAIGLSALLVSTSKQMPLCVAELDRRGLAIPVLIGGAATNRRFGRRTLLVAEDQPYGGGVFYCRDAFEALATMDALQDAASRAAAVSRLVAEARDDGFLRPAPAVVRGGPTRRSAVGRTTVPQPPFYGTRVVPDIPLGEVFDLLDLDELNRLQWGGRGSGAAYEATVRTEFAPTLARLTRDAAIGGWLAPRAVYGLFPVQSDGNDIVVYDPTRFQERDERTPIARFTFPRQHDGDCLCLADYFRPVDSGEVDVAAFQVVTVGPGATRRFEELQARGEYTEAFYTHGLAVETAEAVAEWLHRQIRRELGLAPGQGKRYSWGYAACPAVEDHASVFRLLPAEAELAMQLTSAFQMVPEQSTAALLVHHEAARYFTIRSGIAAGEQVA